MGPLKPDGAALIASLFPDHAALLRTSTYLLASGSSTLIMGFVTVYYFPDASREAPDTVPQAHPRLRPRTLSNLASPGRSQH